MNFLSVCTTSGYFDNFFIDDFSFFQGAEAAVRPEARASVDAATKAPAALQAVGRNPPLVKAAAAASPAPAAAANPSTPPAAA